MRHQKITVRFLGEATRLHEPGRGALATCRVGVPGGGPWQGSLAAYQGGVPGRRKGLNCCTDLNNSPLRSTILEDEEVFMNHIVITGASTGIGAATARDQAAGNTVYIHYHSSAEAAKKVAKEVSGLGGNAVLIQADLSTNEGCEKLAAEVQSHTDTIDVLLNNAGGLLHRHDLEDTTWEIARKTFDLNVFSVMRVTALLLPLLKKAKSANIINISSVAARNGSPTASTYAAAKGAVDTYTRGLAKGLAPSIRANAIAPGIIITPFHDKSTPKEQMEQFMKATPLGYPGQPEEIARAVRFILETPFMTGETIDINGGLNMR